MLKKTWDLNLAQSKFSPFAIGISTVFLCIIYTKLPLLRAYLSTHWFDVICLSETYLDSDTSHEDANLEIVSYTVIRADHPSNTKRPRLSLLQKLAGKEINRIEEGFIRAVYESKISSVKDF